MNFRPVLPVLLLSLLLMPLYTSASDYDHVHRREALDSRITIIKTPADGGIREDIPQRLKGKFAEWREEFLSTGFGREQWNTYANNKHFILTIKIAEKSGKGAGTGKYLWNDAGELVGATITLGSDLHDGYPGPIYYPVMNALSSGRTIYTISGRILAAAKISHEFGHVNQTRRANRKLLQLQNDLMPVYTSIFLSNGRNVHDKKLSELALQMGGTPVEIWESREYWSEVNAMHYLRERIGKEAFYCYVFGRIRHNIETYAKDYEDRFEQTSPGADPQCR